MASVKQWRHQSLEADGSSQKSVEAKDSEVVASGYDEESVDDEDTKQSSSVCRAEKSLGILTQRFVDLLQRARGGIVDLNVVRILDLYSYLLTNTEIWNQRCLSQNTSFMLTVISRCSQTS